METAAYVMNIKYCIAYFFDEFLLSTELDMLLTVNLMIKNSRCFFPGQRQCVAIYLLILLSYTIFERQSNDLVTTRMLKNVNSHKSRKKGLQKTQNFLKLR